MQLVRRIITVFILAVCGLICSSLYAHATVTITVHPQDLSSLAAPDGDTAVVATLRGCGSNPPIVVGTSMLAPTSKTFTPVIGLVTMPLYSSSEISCGGQTGVTWYDITMQSDGADVWKASYTFSASGDLSTMTPNTSAPVVPAPTGDSTYFRLDGANKTNYTGGGLEADLSAANFGTVQSAVTAANGTKSVYLPPATYSDTVLSIPAGTELHADREAIFSGAGATITWHDPTTFTEQGVIYPFFPRGDVRRYGVFPDGVTNWEATFPTRMTNIYANSTVFQVNWAAGLYATSMDFAVAYSGSKMHFDEGAEFGGLIHLISSASPLTCIVGSSGATRTTNVVTLTFSGACTFTVGAQIYVYDMADTTFNGGPFTVATVPDSTHMTYSQTAPDVAFSGYGHVAEPPLANVSWTGTVTTYDRFGTINLVDSFVERVHIKNDPTKHSNEPGQKARGVHIYHTTHNLRIDDITVDDTGNLNNTDACVSIDGNGDNPDSLSIGRIYVKACDTHGVYITGPRHTIGEIRVDAFGAQSYNGSGVQDSDSLAQSQELKGVWLNRTWDDRIGKIVVSNTTDARPNAKYNVLIDETGIITQQGAQFRGIDIGTVIAHNCQAQGCVSFVDRNFAGVNMNAHIGLIEAQALPGTSLSAGYQMVSVNAATGSNRVSVDAMRFDSGSNPSLLAASGTVTNFGVISTTAGGPVRFVELHGKTNIREIKDVNTGSTGTNPVIELSGSGANDSIIHEINLTSPVAVSTPAVYVASLTGFQLGKVALNGFHDSATGALNLDTVANGSVRDLNINCGSAAGNGIFFTTSVTDTTFMGGTVTNCAIGVTRGAGVIYTNVLAQNVDVSGNTSNSAVVAGNIATQNSPGFTATGNGMDVIGTLGAATASFGNTPLFKPTNTVAQFTPSNGASPFAITLGERVANEGNGIGFARGTDGTVNPAWNVTPTGTSGVFDITCGKVTGMFRNCNFLRAVTHTPKTVTFSATPTFTASDSSLQIITLTANVTSSTISGGVDGQLLTLRICENATGGFTFAWPTSVNNPMTISTTASKCNSQLFQFNGATSKWDALTSGIAN